jgi:hypothetical protein
MRVLVTGGRDHQSYEDRMWLYAGLSLLHNHPQMGPVTEIIEGGAAGFDHHALNWAMWRRGCGDHVVVTEVPAEWEKHGRSAGYIRNAEMAKLRPDIVLECPGGKGTANMVEVAKASGLKVIRLEKMPVIRGPHRAAGAPVSA